MKKFLTLVAVVMLSLCALTGCRKMKLEKEARPLVDKIISNNLGDAGAKCKKVKIKEKVSEKVYKGVASLDNGNEVTVYIEDNGDSIYVQLMPF